MFFKRVSLIVGVVLLSLIMGVVGIAAQEPTIDQTLFLTFVPNVQFSPIYVGIAKGYYADEGINITVEYGDEPVGVDLIAANERQFGIIAGEQVIVARENERPVVMVYQWFHDYPIAIVTPLESGIQTVEDLAGRRVGLPGRFGATYSGLVALLSAHNMTERDISMQEVGFNAAEVICLGVVEASAVYINNEPRQIQNRVDENDCGSVSGVHVIPVADSVNLVSNGLVTSERVITENPALVQSMVNAFHYGNRDVILNPVEAYLLSAPYVANLPLSDELRTVLETEAADQAAFLQENPDADHETLAERRAELWERLDSQFDKDLLIQFEILLSTIDLLDTERLGGTELEAWQATEATLITMGFLDAPIDLTSAYTEAFLPLQDEE